VDEMLKVFKALADATRLRILRMLMIKPLCVCEVTHVLKMAQSTVSKHLQILSHAGLVDVVPGGTWTVYHLAKNPKLPLIRAIMSSLQNSKNSYKTTADAIAAKKTDRNKICLRKNIKMQKGC
jgi:ArsR family transcriptional regulator